MKGQHINDIILFNDIIEIIGPQPMKGKDFYYRVRGDRFSAIIESDFGPLR